MSAWGNRKKRKKRDEDLLYCLVLAAAAVAGVDAAADGDGGLLGSKVKSSSRIWLIRLITGPATTVHRAF